MPQSGAQGVLDSKMQRTSSSIVFVIGFILSTSISIFLLAALASMGLQSGPILYTALAAILILIPFGSILGRLLTQNKKKFEYIAGVVMIIVSLLYIVAMVIMNS